MKSASLPVGRRALTRSHVTFYRAVMEGVEPRQAWQLYLHLEDDFTDALASATLHWIRQALIAQAMAAGEPGLIGLFRRDPRQLRDSTTPTLAAFAERFSDAGDFSEAELIAMWKDEFGGRRTKAEERRARLGKRLREALSLIERAVKREPAATDSVAQWLAPRLAEHLEAAGIHTLADAGRSLKASRGARWDAVPGVGEVWADRLAAWLDEHGLASALSDPVPASAPRDLVPLELVPEASLGLVLAPSPALSGQAQTGPNHLGARNDKHAIELWLAARATSPHTLRSYRKNAERLLLWCLYERQLGFQQLTVADCIHYRTWLHDLGRKDQADWAKAGWRIAAQDWIGRRAARRDSLEWRPFDGALSSESVEQELLVVKALFTFLLEGGYVTHHPWKLLGRPAKTAAKLRDATEQFTERSLDTEQWKFLLGGLDPAGGDIEARTHLVLWLGFGCGLRASEMLTLTLGSIVPRTSGWRLRVLGKGSKVRTVPLPSPARRACLQYLGHIGLEAAAVARMAADGSSEPLLRSQYGRRAEGRAPPSSALSYPRLYKDLKGYLARRAMDLEAGDPAGAVKFRAASTHWLRHTCATLALKDGVHLNAIQRLLGHSNLSTTSGYVTAEFDGLQADMERFTAHASGEVTQRTPY